MPRRALAGLIFSVQAIEMAKLIREAGPKTMAQLRGKKQELQVAV